MSNLPARIAALLEKPSLEGLAFLLDNPAYWPPEYAALGWHYDDCGRCAMGLANIQWADGYRRAVVENMPDPVRVPLFVRGKCATDPVGIAAAIRAYLANHPAPPRSGDGVDGPITVTTEKETVCPTLA